MLQGSPINLRSSSTSRDSTSSDSSSDDAATQCRICGLVSSSLRRCAGFGPNLATGYGERLGDRHKLLICNRPTCSITCRRCPQTWLPQFKVFCGPCFKAHNEEKHPEALLKRYSIPCGFHSRRESPATRPRLQKAAMNLNCLPRLRQQCKTPHGKEPRDTSSIDAGSTVAQQTSAAGSTDAPVATSAGSADAPVWTTPAAESLPRPSRTKNPLCLSGPNCPQWMNVVPREVWSIIPRTPKRRRKSELGLSKAATRGRVFQQACKAIG